MIEIVDPSLLIKANCPALRAADYAGIYRGAWLDATVILSAELRQVEKCKILGIIFIHSSNYLISLKMNLGNNDGKPSDIIV